MYFLAIETSCDETSLALLETNFENFDITNFYTCLNSITVSNSLISSQTKLHSQYGGVVPELGAREHAKNMHILLQSLLENLKKYSKFEIQNYANIWENLAGICVTTTPGLTSALKIGLETAKSLKFFLEKYNLVKKIQIYPINHLNGHIISAFYNPNSQKNYSNKEIFGHLHLLVSGGNSQLFYLETTQKSQLIAQTLDDAVGETIDKIGRMLGFRYPAGKIVSQIAGSTMENPLKLTVGMLGPKMAFSFSGLKTAVRYLVQKQNFATWYFEKTLSDDEINLLLEASENQEKIHILPKYLQFIRQVCISTQTVIVQQLINKVKLALDKYEVKSLGLSGGVSANLLLRKEIASFHSLPVFYPLLEYTGDNAVMIGLAGISDLQTAQIS